jgi:hypothetical protein
MIDHQSCPPRDVLIEAAAPNSTPSLREGVADHLVACALCAEEFRLLQALRPWAADHARLLASDEAAERSPVVSRRGILPPGYAIAAVLAVVAVALTVEVRRLGTENQALTMRANATAAPVPPALEGRVAEQQRTIADLEQRLLAAETPDLNPPIIDLEAADAPRTAAPPAARAALGNARHVVFILNTAHRHPGAAYDVDIVAGDRVVWTGSGLTQSADGTLTLVVPRTLAASGSRIRLYARTGDQRALVEQYVVPATR